MHDEATTTEQNTTREILVVDDDPIVRRVIQASLTEAGYSIAVCSDGTSAWKRNSD